ncbi:MAG: O-antigen ligase family protein [Candidatus Omnitrophica bacterium]|nr:O-antigen ligase family protein [Candidatus Omnitrophota bacterium]
MQKTIKAADFIIYWLIILLPFSQAIAPAPMNVFMGMLIFLFLLKKILKREAILRDSPLNRALLLFFIVTCLSLIHSIDLKDSLKGGVGRFAQYIFILLALSGEIKDKAHVRKIFFSLSLGALLVSIDALFQVATGRDFIRGYPPVYNLDLVRATASFKDPNNLGVYLSAAAPLVFGLTLYHFRRLGKLAMSLASLIIMAGIFLTYSRPTLLAVYVALFLLAIARKDKVLIAALVLLTLISPILVPKSVKDWIRLMEYNPLRVMCNDDRIAAYRNTLQMIKAHPFIGVGANTFMKNYSSYKELPEYRGIVTSDYMYAHNNFLHMAAEIGLVGLGIFLWLLCQLFLALAAVYRRLKDDYLKVTLLSLIACLVSFLVNGLTESSLYSSRLAVIFWYLAGFALGLKKFTDEKN